jgi:DNA polymerase-4
VAGARRDALIQTPRSVLHVDMDAFYASVEQRDRPELRGRPVIVGADPSGRGVVSAASYEARRFGVHSAMPIGRAKRLCPHGAFLPVDMDKYAGVSREVMAILAAFTPLLEPVSIDEAFLDVTGTEGLHGDGPTVARAIKSRIAASLRLTASVGVAANKFVAKVASDLRKPDGLVVVAPGSEADFLAPLPVARLWGVGRVTAEGLEAMGLQTIGQLAAVPAEYLEARFGRADAPCKSWRAVATIAPSSRSRRRSPWVPRRPSAAITVTPSAWPPPCASRPSAWRGSCGRRATRAAA